MSFLHGAFLYIRCINNQPIGISMLYRNYVAFGLHILSGVECPELSSGASIAADVTINIGSVPEFLENPTGCGVLYETTAGTFLLKLDQIARYLVRNGNEIIVDPAPGAEEDAIRLFLLGSCFGALLFQRGMLPLHGSAIATSMGAVVFAGASGHGKSTLAGAFHRRGFQVLSDDVSAITTRDGIPVVLPSYPRLMLWADAVEHLGVAQSKLRPARAQLEKYHYRVDQTPLTTEYPLKAVYLLVPTNSLEFAITPLSGFDKIHKLTDNTYRGQFLTGMKLASQHFRQIAAVAEKARVACVNRPESTYQLEELADMIQQDFMT